jgi:sugar phosphate isomerase/epimerase
MNRKYFLKTLGAAGLAGLAIPGFASPTAGKKGTVVGVHVWIFAAKQPGYDVTPILPQIFADVKYAGFDGVETMEHPLRKPESTALIAELIEEHNLPLIGTSYSGQMWDITKHQEIYEDVENIMGNMQKLKARTFGTSVGRPQGRIKTEAELDAQAELLKRLIALGKQHGVTLNLHNHTYEVENELHDLKGTLKRIPDAKLGPDLNWLLRAKVDPVWFLQEFDDQIIFLHLRDQHTNGRWSESLGEGDVDFKAIGKTLKQIDFKGDVMIELAHENDFEPTRPIRESLKMSRQHLKKATGI